MTCVCCLFSLATNNVIHCQHSQSPRPTAEPTDTQDECPFCLPCEDISFFYTFSIPLIPLAIIDILVYPHNKLAQGLVVLPPVIIAIMNTIFAAVTITCPLPFSYCLL